MALAWQHVSTQPGAELDRVTPHMREVDSELTYIHRAWKVVVDSREACAIDAGELIAASKTTDPNGNSIELGELVDKGDGGKFVVPVELPRSSVRQMA